MALAKYKEKIEDLYTCKMCSKPFDTAEHKPKFLVCSHSICLSCLTMLDDGTPILCPFCGNHSIRSINDLPNNSYILAWLDPCPKKNPQWCQECGKTATQVCRLMPAGHHPTSILKDFTSPKESHEFQEESTTNENFLDSIIRKGKDAEFSLQQLSAALKDVQDGNKACLEWASQLKAELTMDSDETFQSLSLKLKESSELINEELEDIKQLEENHLIHLEKAITIFESKSKIPKMLSGFESYIFSLEFTRGSRNLGVIKIKPSESFYRPFMTALAQFCHPSPMVFGSSIVEAFPTGYATIGFFHRDFIQDVPDPATFNEDASSHQADTKLNVGFIDSGYDGNSIIGFQLVFLLQGQMKNCPLFGQIVGGSDVVDVMSQKPPKERDDFNVSVKFLKRDD